MNQASLWLKNSDENLEEILKWENFKQILYLTDLILTLNENGIAYFEKYIFNFLCANNQNLNADQRAIKELNELFKNKWLYDLYKSCNNDDSNENENNNDNDELKIKVIDVIEELITDKFTQMPNNSVISLIWEIVWPSLDETTIPKESVLLSFLENIYSQIVNCNFWENTETNELFLSNIEEIRTILLSYIKIYIINEKLSILEEVFNEKVKSFLGNIKMNKLPILEEVKKFLESKLIQEKDFEAFKAEQTFILEQKKKYDLNNQIEQLEKQLKWKLNIEDGINIVKTKVLQQI